MDEGSEEPAIEVYAPFVLHAEWAIHEADVAWQCALQDGDVWDTLSWMRGELRGDRGLPFSELDASKEDLILVIGGGAKPMALVLTRILTHWQSAFSEWGRLTDSELLNVLRELTEGYAALSRGPNSRAYLAYLSERQRQLGLSVDLVDGDGNSVAAQGTSPDDLSLERLGAQWLLRPESIDVYDALVHRVGRLAAEGRDEELLETLETLLQSAQGAYERATLLWLQGWVCEQAGEIEDAVEMLRQALALDATHVAAQRTLGMIHFDAGESEQAISALERVLQLEPRDEWSYEALLDLYIAAGDGPSEIDLLRRWTRAVPRRLFAHYQLSLAMQRAGRTWRGVWHRLLLWLSRPVPGTLFLDWAAWVRFHVGRRGTQRVLRRLAWAYRTDPDAAWWAPWLQAAALHVSEDDKGARARLLDLDVSSVDQPLVYQQARRVWGDVLDDRSFLWASLEEAPVTVGGSS